MRLTALFPHWRGMRVMHVCAERDHFTLIAETISRAACCPLCHRPSRAVHSRYQRRVADLPCSGRAVTLVIHARRFFCRAPDCLRRTFAERLTPLVAPGARRSHALDAALTRIGMALGGKSGARLARHLAMPTSDDTLLRLVRAMPLPLAVQPQVLGVDHGLFILPCETECRERQGGLGLILTAGGSDVGCPQQPMQPNRRVANRSHDLRNPSRMDQ